MRVQGLMAGADDLSALMMDVETLYEQPFKKVPSPDKGIYVLFVFLWLWFGATSHAFKKKSFKEAVITLVVYIDPGVLHMSIPLMTMTGFTTPHDGL